MLKIQHTKYHLVNPALTALTGKKKKKTHASPLNTIDEDLVHIMGLSVAMLMSLFLWLRLFNGSCHTGVLEHKRASLRRQWQLLQA